MTLLELYKKTPESFGAFLFDIDGTVLLGGEPIPGAPEFLAFLREEKKPFFFLTNNCAQTHEEIAVRLTKAGIYALPDEIISSADPVPAYFRKINKTGTALRYFLIGRAEEIPGVIEYEKDPARIMECDGVLHNAGKYDWTTVITAIVNFFPFCCFSPERFFCFTLYAFPFLTQQHNVVDPLP
jgi:hypothetical protein